MEKFTFVELFVYLWGCFGIDDKNEFCSACRVFIVSRKKSINRQNLIANNKNYALAA